MSFPDSELEYLSPSFDATSLTVPRLRSILVAHNVAYPSSAKKPQLVNLFNENIAPQASSILSARSKTKRSTKGISDVPSSQASTVDEEDSDAASMPPPPVPESARRSSRRTTRALVDANVDNLRPSEVLARRGSSKHARASDTDADARPPSRRTRHSITPTPKTDEPEPATWRQGGADSPFTSDNPFQSGSSPPAEARSADKERRRRTLDPRQHREQRLSGASRRRTENFATKPQQDGITVPSRETFDMQVARRQGRDDEPAEAEQLEPGEEFTPEEQLELVRERAKSGRMDVVPARRRKERQSPTGVARVAPWAVALAMLGGLGTVWRQEKIAVGYCGVGRPSTSLAGVEIPDWASVLQPQCEPCPQHAYCYPDLETVCEPDFILKPHPLSLGGLVPLPPTCEPDSQKARKVKAVADRAVEELRERNAKWECGELVDETGKHLQSPDMSEEDLKRDMSDKRRKGMSQSEFEDLWKGAIGEIRGRDEIVSSVDETGTAAGAGASPGTGSTRRLRSTSLARIPLTCAIRRSIRLALARHLWQLVSLLLLTGSAGYARLSITSARATEARAKQLARLALDKLAVQAALHAQDPRAYPEPWISMAQLRDDVLRDEFSAARRTKLWEKVQGKVEGNANVRPMVREGRSGDVSRVWEWVGAVQAIEGTPASAVAKREGARLSLGPVAGDSSPRPVKEEEGRMEMVERGKWDEGRPIY